MLIPLFFLISITTTTMVYINDTSGTINIPKHVDVFSASGYTLVLSSNLSDEVVIVDSGEDISTNTLYYKFALDDTIGYLNVGEYTYNLYDDSNLIIETGLLTFGEFKREIIVNNTFNKEKIQYNG